MFTGFGQGSCAFSSALTLVRTGSILSDGNLHAPFSSMCMTSPGDTSMPPTLTGTFTAWTVVATSIVLSFGVLATYPPSGLFPSELPLLARDLGVALLACWAYVGVFGLLGAVYKRPYLIGVAFILIWEGVIPFVPGTIHYFTVKYYIRCVYSHPVELSEVQWLLQPLDPVSVPVAVLTLLFIGALSAGLTVWTAYRREYILEQASG